jgi:2-iminobutanoate/2-iminopropanoate deaminase
LCGTYVVIGNKPLLNRFDIAEEIFMPGVEIVSEEVANPTKFGSPTSLGIRIENFIFVSGMMPWDVERCVVGIGDIVTQTKQALGNLSAVLEASGASLGDIVKINFYLRDIRDKQKVWEVRKEYFTDHRPASTLVAVSSLVDPQALLEVDAIAYKKETNID